MKHAVTVFMMTAGVFLFAITDSMLGDVWQADALVTWGRAKGKWSFARIESRDHGKTWLETVAATVPVHDEDKFSVLFHTAGPARHDDGRAIFLEQGKDAHNRAYLWGTSGYCQRTP